MQQIPVATYRLQLNRELDLVRALGLVDYLAELGAGGCYLSPLLAATPGSNHGYDVVDHGKVNPELGTEEALVALTSELKRRQMSVIVDVVPNHMCVAGSRNAWWTDVLENGPSSPFARYFDIDWQPPKADLKGKVLLPILGDQFGSILEEGQIALEYRGDTFVARYHETLLPIAPRTWHHILEPALDALRLRLPGADPSLLELESIVTALGHLPLRTDTEEARVRERVREKTIIKRRLGALLDASAVTRTAVVGVVRELNGVRGDPSSVDRLENLLVEQGYRPSFWRVASDEINYRRFFDINELAAIRVEEAAVFRAVHELPLRLARKGLITGLRIDHVDGLLAPGQYLADLQRAFGPHLRPPGTEEGDAYIVVEKILGPGEHLPASWPVRGTTGYEFAIEALALMIAPRGLSSLEATYARFTGNTEPFADVVYESKKLVLKTAMSAELTVLARKLDAISEQQRTTRDFTLSSLQEALGELIACFPVYRTYVARDDDAMSEADRRQVEHAVYEAKRRNAATSGSTFDFLRSLLLLEDSPRLDDAERRARRDFVLRFQQLTGPIAAKGLEDTAFYRYFPLSAQNEVGGGHVGPLSVEAFHALNVGRRARAPHGMNASSTHDTKRGEDVRARLTVLSELPDAWAALLEVARVENRKLKVDAESVLAPDANEEYLLYQTLIGAWPVGLDAADPDFIARISEYMLKAIREAKIHTSWINPNEPYERATRAFVAAVLDAEQNGRFLSELGSLRAVVDRAGWFNALSLLVLKLGAPGVPDFYQGSELWNLSLVDPDNRHPVDFELRRRLLTEVRRDAEADAPATIERLTRTPEDGRIKLLVTHRGLKLRAARRATFEHGTYEPLAVEGPRSNAALAFARRHEGRDVVVAAGRFFTSIAAAAEPPIGPRWAGTHVVVGPAHDRYLDALTGRTHAVQTTGSLRHLALPQVFGHLPVAMLEGL